VTAWDRTSADGFELVFGYRDEAAYADTVERLCHHGVAGKIAERDPTLWGHEAQAEASKRLAWVDLAEHSRPLVAEIEQLRRDLAGQGIDHVVLCGMGGSSLAPEVITRTAGVDLTVLDSSDPDYVRAAVTDRLESTGGRRLRSKSGGTVETDSQKRAFEHAFRHAGPRPRRPTSSWSRTPARRVASDPSGRYRVFPPTQCGRPPLGVSPRSACAPTAWPAAHRPSCSDEARRIHTGARRGQRGQAPACG
jgi:hypothetical protein